ncbi:MAG: Crp/Fnr family transcriptional regulator [Kofleriaceae bacterium]|nr:Crp/Fnr family transcriptional regulator [Kofleriaceae bacterium]MBP9170635.1 Crp/Fnr family transcriptional regulator [Kofleriaceae bacterium]MBP9859797.1 Crp/Fnr family transcriptional regulator [Kofleriaceae bacterium]
MTFDDSPRSPPRPTSPATAPSSRSPTATGSACERTVALLRTSHFLRAVPTALLERLATRANVRELAAGDALWREGDPAVAFHLIVTGLVTIRRSLASGAEVIVAIFGPRENVGDTAALEGTRYPAEAIVSSTTATIIKLDATHVLALSAQSAELSLALQRALCRHSAALRTKVEILAAGSVRARLANLFLHLATRFGDDLPDGTVVIPIALPRATLASLVSARVETVIRALGPWEKSGLVKTRAGAFHLGDLGELEASAAGG